MRRAAWTLTLIALPALASAHTGDHGSMSFLAGMLHPFTGIDHLLAMLALGAIAGSAAGTARWLLPLSALGAVAFGGALGIVGVQMPLTEAVIATSVVCAGIGVLGKMRLPLHVAAALTALFAVFHGYAHGSEMSTEHAALTYGAGILLGTASVLLLGMCVGRSRAVIQSTLSAKNN